MAQLCICSSRLAQAKGSARPLLPPLKVCEHHMLHKMTHANRPTHTVFISDFLQDFICGNYVAGPNANPCQMRQFSPLSTSTCVTHLLLQVPETKPSHASPEAKGSQGWPEANGSQAHATLTHCVTHIHTDLKHVSSSCHMAPCTHTNCCMSRHRCKWNISHANGNLTNHMQI